MFMLIILQHLPILFSELVASLPLSQTFYQYVYVHHLYPCYTSSFLMPLNSQTPALRHASPFISALEQKLHFILQRIVISSHSKILVTFSYLTLTKRFSRTLSSHIR
jgi:hypothetical protein